MTPGRVEWRSLRFSYEREGPLALRGISLAWNRGEVLAIAGPNGSGKSTCLRALLGLGHSSGGDVWIDDAALSTLDLDTWRRRIAFLPQRPYLPPRCTVRDSILLLEPAISDESIGRSLERVGLASALAAASGTGPLDAKVGELSMGQQQRVALARTLCREAPILVLDEPDANLDRDGIRLLVDIIEELRRDRMILVVAHTPELLALADRVITLRGGRVASDEAAPARDVATGS